MMKERAINWKWLNAKERHSEFWCADAEIPDNLLVSGDLTRRTHEAFKNGKDRLFEPLKNAQPKTWSALMDFCEPLLLTHSNQYPDLVSIVTIAGELVVFVDHFTIGDDLRDWAEIFSILPEPLHAYYTNFNGMRASYSQLDFPANLPLNIGKWRRLSDYQKEESINKKLLKRIENEIGDLKEIKIFIQTDWRDLVMVNAAAKDRKIYLAPEGKFDETLELINPAQKIDEMCAHVLTGSIEPYYLESMQQ